MERAPCYLEAERAGPPPKVSGALESILFYMIPQPSQSILTLTAFRL